jgi:hypothetical protein
MDDDDEEEVKTSAVSFIPLNGQGISFLTEIELLIFSLSG